MSCVNRIPFTKLMASGNDFVLIDLRGDNTRPAGDAGTFALKVCTRKTGVGADGLLLLEDSDRAAFRMRIINPDGSEVPMCGNGARCAALYAREKDGLKGDFAFEAGAGILHASVKGKMVRVQMTPPRGIRGPFPLDLSHMTCQVWYINTGVPHVVFFVHGINDIDVAEIGAEIRHHRAFQPEGANADFVEVLCDNTVRLRTFERGVEGETLACGTGSVAAALIAATRDALVSPVRVRTRGGETLLVHFDSQCAPWERVFLEGGAEYIYEGRLCYV